jgi:GNAT superfamily N-acetyltransferase
MTTPTTDIVLRPLAPDDSLEAITALLHRAYASLGAMGLNDTAVDQSVDVTRKRFARGQGYVLEDLAKGGTIVGTVVVDGPYDPIDDPWARASPWYYRRDVAHFHQLAVEPALQGQGLGRRLIAACEAWAAQRGMRALALDTAVPATHLRAAYAALGWRDVDEVQWPGKVYRSVVMSKGLREPAPNERNAEHQCARVRTLWANVQARDWAALRAQLADDCTMHWPCTRERFLDADAIVRVQAIYPEGWSIRVGEVFGTLDGRVVSSITVTHGEKTFFAHSVFRFDGTGRVVKIEEHWSSLEAPPPWRTREAIGAYERT